MILNEVLIELFGNFLIGIILMLFVICFNKDFVLFVIFLLWLISIILGIIFIFN